MRRPGGQHLLFAVNQIAGVKGRDFEPVPVGDGIGGTGFHAVAAEDASVVVDVVDLGIALGAADPILGRVLRRLDIDAIRGAGGGAQEASHTLFQAMLVALEHVHSPIALLKHRALQRPRTVGVVLDDGGLKHLPEGDAHAFGDRRNVLEDGHTYLVYRKRRSGAGRGSTRSLALIYREIRSCSLLRGWCHPERS